MMCSAQTEHEKETPRADAPRTTIAPFIFLEKPFPPLSFFFFEYTSARQPHGVFSLLQVKTPLIVFQSIFDWRKKTFVYRTDRG